MMKRSSQMSLKQQVTPEMAKMAAESLNGLLSKKNNPAKAQGEQ